MSDPNYDDDALDQFRPPREEDDYQGYTPAAPALDKPVAPVLPGEGTGDSPSSEAAGQSKVRNKKGVDKSAVRRIAAKYEELKGGNPAHLELLAAALNVPNTTLDLTIAVIAGGRTGLIALTDTLALSEMEDPYESLVTAISLKRQRIKGVWAVLAQFGAVVGAPPTADVKAGGDIAKAARNLDAASIIEIASVLTLAKK